MMTDPIADMLTRIRNANSKGHNTVAMNSSKMKVSIAEVMQKEGFIKEFQVEGEGAKRTLEMKLKYSEDKKVINGIKRISKPGLRVYCGKEDIPRVLGGLGIAILSTPKGVMAGKHARKLGVGGEVLCFVW